MFKQIGLFVSGIVVLVAALVLGYFVAFRSSTTSETSQEKPALDVPLSQAAPNTLPAQTDKPSLSVQKNAAPQQSALPAPADFDRYEQFAEETSTRYQDIVVGNGEVLASGDSAAVIYKGWLSDGTLFDESHRNDQGQLQPFVLKVGAGQVIRGWEEGLLGMKAGGKRRLIVPSSAGYGSMGQDPIPPNAMLIFDVELVQVQKN